MPTKTTTSFEIRASTATIKLTYADTFEDEIWEHSAIHIKKVRGSDSFFLIGRYGEMIQLDYTNSTYPTGVDIDDYMDKLQTEIATSHDIPVAVSGVTITDVDTNLETLNGNTIDLNTGNSSVGTQRIVRASDDPIGVTTHTKLDTIDTSISDLETVTVNIGTTTHSKLDSIEIDLEAINLNIVNIGTTTHAKLDTIDLSINSLNTNVVNIGTTTHTKLDTIDTSVNTLNTNVVNIGTTTSASNKKFDHSNIYRRLEIFREIAVLGVTQPEVFIFNMSGIAENRSSSIGEYTIGIGIPTPTNLLDITFPTGATFMQVTSTSGDDTAGGTGANAIRITGLDSNGLWLEEDIALGGTTAVTTVNQFRHINQMLVVATGDDDINVGNIYITSNDTFTSGK
jgi:hypothetical protein